MGYTIHSLTVKYYHSANCRQHAIKHKSKGNGSLIW